MPLPQKGPDIVLVDGESLGLPVRPMGPSNIDPLIPMDSKPSEGCEDVLLTLWGASLLVCVLNPENERALVTTGQSVVEKGDVRGPHVGIPCGTRSDPHSDPGFAGKWGAILDLGHCGVSTRMLETPNEIIPKETLIWYDGPIFFTLEGPAGGPPRVAIWTDEDVGAKTLTYVVVETMPDRLDALKDGLLSLRDFLVSESLQRWVVVTTRSWRVISWSPALTSDELVLAVGEAGLPDQGVTMKPPETSGGAQRPFAGPMVASSSL